MEAERMRKTGKKNITWTPAMSEFVLKYLAEQVRAGRKNHNGFKICILSDAAEAASKKFGKKMSFVHVQNHLKTVKKRWGIIECMMNVDGATFHPDTNVIEMQYEAYQKHVEAHPGDEKFINRPIKNYEEMKLVCGNDSVTEVNLVDQTNGDNDDDVQFVLNSTPSGSKKRKKANQAEMEFEDTQDGRKLHYSRWSPIMSKFLLTCLVGETEAGHKGMVGFKVIALHNAAEAISKKFSKPVTSSHVQNHLKTLKKYWCAIQRIKKTGGAVFNSDADTLRMGLEEYQKYIEAHPGDDQFINKPIKYYNELEIVFGNDNIIESGTRKATEDLTEASSPDAKDGDGIGTDNDDVRLLTNVDGVCDDDNDGGGNDDSDKDNNNDEGGDGDVDGDDDDDDVSDDVDVDGATSNRSRKRKLVKTETNIASPVERMSSNATMKRKHNMRWSSEMTEFLLNYLVEQGQTGNKGSNAFKASVLNGAVCAINEKFGKELMFSNVQNHLKTIRKWWQRIELIKSLSGVTFHSDTNTLEMQLEEYQKHVQAHPGDDHLINKPLKIYSQLEIIYGNDNQVVGSSEVDIAAHDESPEVDKCTNEEVKEDQDEPQPVTPIAINLGEGDLVVHDGNEQQSGTSSGSRKKKRPNQSQENLTNFVGHMAVALNELSTDKTVRFAKDIMAELRTIQSEFSSWALRKAQRFLVENSLDGAFFISYNRDEKIAWMEDFVDEHLGGNDN